MTHQMFFALLLALFLWRMHWELRDPSRLPLVKRLTVAAILALLFAAALSAQEMATAVIIRCYPCGWYGWFCCVG